MNTETTATKAERWLMAVEGYESSIADRWLEIAEIVEALPEVQKPTFALCVMCGKPTENLASDDTEYQCAPCANVR